MKAIFKLMLMAFSIMQLSSCEKDAGLLPAITFKTGSTYTSADASIKGGTAITIGINASKSEDKDVLKKFNISKAINGVGATTVFDKTLSGTEGDIFAYDFTTTLESIVGQKNTYTFTVTNRDGLVGQVSLAVTIQ